jgi:two-component system, OmpR family, heavy metal sensor histidine kinase CusS
MNTRSIGFRLTVWYAAVLTGGFLLFGTLIWFSLRHQMIAEIDRELNARANQFIAYFTAESAEGGTSLRDELNEFCQALPTGNYVVLHGGNGFSFLYPDRFADKTTADSRILRRQFNDRNEPFDLEIGAPVQSVAHTLDLLRLLLLSLSPVVIVIACIGGAMLSKRALKPVQGIAAAALTISIENLSERLPVPPTGDELAALTAVLNSMLSRLESAVKALSRFVADASHELRTPLAVIQTTAELALRRARSPESHRQSLEQITSEAQRMTRLVEDLLFLARSEMATAQLPLAATDLRDILSQVCTEMASLCDARRIRVNISLGDEAAVISGNAPALHRLFLVLLDNAVKYSKDGGEVSVTLIGGESIASVAIEDFGPGISDADLPHIFERFYRSDVARSTEGYGLGLSLAKSVAHAHGAEIAVQSAPGQGAEFSVAFPLRSKRASGNLQFASV